MRYEQGHKPERPIRPGEHIGRATEFKPGRIPDSKLPVGSVTIREERDGVRRAWVKIEEPTHWILRAVWIWLSSGGIVPKGFVLHHLNEDPLDDRIENLACVIRAGHIAEHRLELQEAKEQTVPIRKIICSHCGELFDGKYQKANSLCDKCARINRAEKSRSYKQRVRLRDREKRVACSALPG